MHNKDIILSFNGEITSDIISEMLDIAEIKLIEISERSSIRKRIFQILVEGLQNVYHHTSDFTIESEKYTNSKSALFIVWYEGNKYNIYTSNFIENQNIQPLRDHLNKINSLSTNELRSFYKETLYKKEISRKGRASLGLIDIARKSGEKLEYEFNPITDEVSFFNLTIKVVNEG